MWYRALIINQIGSVLSFKIGVLQNYGVSPEVFLVFTKDVGKCLNSDHCNLKTLMTQIFPFNKVISTTSISQEIWLSHLLKIVSLQMG